MNTQVATSVQEGLPPPGGRSLGKGGTSGDSPELQALFQSLMASLMGPLMMNQAALPMPVNSQGETASGEANGFATATPATQEGIAMLMAQANPTGEQKGDPLAALL